MSRHSVWLLGGALCLLVSGAGAAPSLTTLYTFHGPDGSDPVAPLTIDQDGNLYGTTLSGGPGTSIGSLDGDGTVFELSGYNHFRFRTVWAFDASDYTPSPAPLILDASNNIYGSTVFGGLSGSGLVYELTGQRHKSFSDIADIGGVSGLGFDSPGVVFQTGALDRTGDLIGLTSLSGSNNVGEIFALSGDNHSTSKILYSASGAFSPFSGPNGPLIADAFGNLYGTTGGLGAGDGTVFELSGQYHKAYRTLASFNSNTTGSIPNGGLSFDTSGNLYGVTEAGGPNGGGTIFELSGADHRRLRCLYGFGDNGGPNGTGPNGALAIDSVGNIFGTTYFGGIDGGRAGTSGVIFKLSRDHKTFSVPYQFTGNADGRGPQAGLVADTTGNLYGTTSLGGSTDGVGTVFKLSNVGFIPN